MRIPSFAIAALLASAALATAQPARVAPAPGGQGVGQTRMLQERNRVETTTRSRVQRHERDGGWSGQAPEPVRMEERERLRLLQFDGRRFLLRAGQQAD